MTSALLRRATADDCALVWAWNCAPDVRAVSGDRRPVELAEHARWYAERLARTDAPMWIVESDGVPVGVVRVDPGADREARISIALARGARGRGIGKHAITAACASWHGAVVAQIRTDNQPSRACFEACGFSAVAVVGDIVVYRKPQVCS
jgi:RimJ/RimL family protein N-acetyltransferase